MSKCLILFLILLDISMEGPQLKQILVEMWVFLCLHFLSMVSEDGCFEKHLLILVILMFPCFFCPSSMEEHSTVLWCSTRWTVLLSHTSSVTHQPALPLSLSRGSTASSKWFLQRWHSCGFIFPYFTLTEKNEMNAINLLSCFSTKVHGRWSRKL